MSLEKYESLVISFPIIFFTSIETKISLNLNNDNKSIIFKKLFNEDDEPEDYVDKDHFWHYLYKFYPENFSLIILEDSSKKEEKIKGKLIFKYFQKDYSKSKVEIKVNVKKSHFVDIQDLIIKKNNKLIKESKFEVYFNPNSCAKTDKDTYEYKINNLYGKRRYHFLQ